MATLRAKGWSPPAPHADETYDLRSREITPEDDFLRQTEPHVSDEEDEWCSLAISPQSAVQKKAPAKKPASRRNLFANLSLNDGGSSTQPDGLSFDAFASASAIALEQRRAHQRQQEQQRQRQLAEEEERERARLERERERQLARVRAEEEQRWAEEQAEIEVHCGWMDRGESGLGGDGLGWAALG